MLRRATAIRGFHLGALDGEIGHVKDFYFDDTNWHVRYLIADTGKWLPHRKVLIAPQALGSISPEERVIHVQLTRDQVERSPSIEADKPVSRQMEEEYMRYFGWPFYWTDPLLWGAPIMAGAAAPPAERDHIGDPHLRSVNEIIGYDLVARDGALGKIDDFLIDDSDWAIHEVLVDVRNWLSGQRMVSPLFIKSVNWSESTVLVRSTREALAGELPEYRAEPEEHTYKDTMIEAYASGRTFPLP